jgi:hypothetical protein
MARVPAPRRAWFAAAVPMFALLFAALGAAAQGPPPPLASEERLAEARHHFQRAVGLYESADYDNALTAFQAAYDTAPAATILYNIGLTNKALYRYPEAIDALERYLADSARDRKLGRERRRQVARLIEEMKALLAPVTFSITPIGARLILDGRPITLPSHHTLPLAAGPHVAEVSAEGHHPEQRAFSVTINEPLVVTFALTVKAKAAKLRVTSSAPGTVIEIDGLDRGLAPLEVELDAGVHDLVARRDGYEPHRSKVDLRAEQERNLDLTLVAVHASSAPVYRRWWFWTGVGAAIAGGTAAALLMRPGTEAPLTGGLGAGSVPVRLRGR